MTHAYPRTANGRIDADAADLIVNDASDALVPIVRTMPAAPGSVDPIDIRLQTDTSPAHSALAAFVASREPAWGWRRVVFIVSGICLQPSRLERALRESVAVLLTSVESSNIDTEKESSS